MFKTVDDLISSFCFGFVTAGDEKSLVPFPDVPSETWREVMQESVN